MRRTPPTLHAALTPVPGHQRLLYPGGSDLPTHTERFGPAPPPVDDLGALLADAGLLGRGGAAFPSGRKLAAISGRNPVVIGNGAEGEPVSWKDAVLLGSSPHLVLDGLAVVARAVGSRDVHLYAAPTALTAADAALSERRASGYGTVPVRLAPAADSFVSGEKSAVISALEGRPPLPRTQVVSNSESGFRGRPTLIYNVETLAHIALIARYGSAWFRSAGTDSEPGTTLVTLSGAVRNPGVVEVPMGVGFRDLIESRGRTDTRGLRAVLVGGYHGAWIPATALGQSNLSQESLRRHYAAPGAGVVRALSLSECGLQASADIVRYLAAQSSGQCGPCVNGLPQMSAVLDRLALGPAQVGLDHEVLRLSALVDGRGACRHPDGTARFVRSTLRVFAQDVSRHLAGECDALQPSPIARTA